MVRQRCPIMHGQRTGCLYQNHHATKSPTNDPPRHPRCNGAPVPLVAAAVRARRMVDLWRLQNLDLGAREMINFVSIMVGFAMVFAGGFCVGRSWGNAEVWREIRLDPRWKWLP